MTELEKEENKNLVAELVNSEIQELEELERARREEEMATAKAEKERLKQQRKKTCFCFAFSQSSRKGLSLKNILAGS